MRYLLLIPALFVASVSFGQTKLVLTGQVLDAKTKEPLALATVEVKGRVEQTLTDSRGRYEFKVPKEYFNDSLYVSYLGFKPAGKKISDHQSEELFYLEEFATVLNEVVVATSKLKLRDVDKSMVVVKGNIYASQHEVTNAEFTAFLNHLEETNQIEQFKKSGFDLSGYDQATRAFFERYQTASRIRRYGKSKDELSSGDFPAVNISHEAAIAYCDWLTEQYNGNTKRKKFKKVKFRLPTLNEWQISAIGYTRFQSWVPGENTVEVFVPDDTTTMGGVGKKTSMKVTKDMYYPWSRSFNYMKKPMNHLGCFLGNFKVEKVAKPCPVNPPAYDGFVMMAPVECYFPNDMGLYDVVGNVAEMVSEKGKACGGSWNDVPFESTVFSVKPYTRPESTVGFRVFMEVLE